MFKKTVLFLCLSLFLFNCKTKKKTESTVATKPGTAKLSTLEIAQKKWSGSTQGDLDEGKNIFTGKCTKCHEAPTIVTRSEKKWLHEIDDMSPRAGLSPEEKLKLTKYILSYREANTTTD